MGSLSVIVANPGENNEEVFTKVEGRWNAATGLLSLLAEEFVDDLNYEVLRKV